MSFMRIGATVLIGATMIMPQTVAAQDNCQAALPAFTAAMRATTPDALEAYLVEHGPCFEVPARSRLQALGATAAPAAEPAPPVAPVAAPAPAAPVGPVADASCAQEGIRSERYDQPVEFTITNTSDMTISVGWIDYEGGRAPAGPVAPGGVYGGQSFVTHPFEITGPDGQCLKIVVLQDGANSHIFGE